MLRGGAGCLCGVETDWGLGGQTKCANVPNLYVDQVLDSPRELRSQGGKCAYRVPITLHPHSPGLHSAFFPCGTLPGSQVKSVSGPSLMALRELQQHPHKAEELRMSVARHEGPEYELLVLGGEAGGLGRQSYSSGHVKCETEAGGHIVPIVVVPSLACIGKEGKHTSPKHEHGYKPQGCFPSFVSPSSDAKHLDPVQSSQALCGGFPLRNSPCSPGIQGVSVVSHEIEADQSSIDQRLSTRSPGTTQQGLPDAQSSENSSRAASSKLSETESESLINDSGNTNRELPMHPHGQTVMGKDGIYCCGGVRQVPASGPGALLPLVDIPGPGSLAAKHCEEVWCSHVNLRTSNPGVTESEETRTASIHSASHRNQVQDTASGKSLLLTKQQPQLHAPRHTDIQVRAFAQIFNFFEGLREKKLTSFHFTILTEVFRLMFRWQRVCRCDYHSSCATE